MNLKLIGSIVCTAIVINFLITLKFKSPDEETKIAQDSETITSVDNRPKKEASLKVGRTPASSNVQPEIEKVIYKPEVKRAELDRSNFASPSTSTPPVAAAGRGPASRTTSVNPKSTPIPLVRENASPINYDLPVENKENKKTNSKEDEKIYLTSTPPQKSRVITTTKNKTISSATTSGTSSGSTGASSSINTCSSNIIGGSFSNPIGVSLSCSSPSTIHYCVGLDTGSGCCDPLAASAVYSSQIIIGPENGNYCLSYYGQSASNGMSTVYEQSYTINTTLPNLQVAHPQIYYQTTQLTGKSLMNSSDFGKVGYSIGQINLMTHDPGPSALNLDCEQIISTYSTYTAPSPLEVLTALDVSGDNPGLQIEIPLRLDQMSYGDNFITSYIVNSNFVAPVYSCSTSKVILNDFEFFQDDVAFGDAGTSSVREFTGGLTPFGFFEDESTVFRGPAGESTENNAGQKLEYGMFGIFF